jgi:hypothetical protein
MAEDERAVEAARTQSLFRTVNERVEALNEAFTPLIEDGEWVCECADLACVETIVMPLDEYEEIRSHPNRFFVSPGHVDLAIERVVEARSGYEIVEKLGVAGELAVAHYRRAQNGDTSARKPRKS